MHPSAHACTVSEPLLTKLQQFRHALLDNGVTRAVAEAFADGHPNAGRECYGWQLYTNDDPETKSALDDVTGLRAHPAKADFEALRHEICSVFLIDNGSVLTDIIAPRNDAFVLTVELDAASGAVSMHLDEQVTAIHEAFRYAGPIDGLLYASPRTHSAAARMRDDYGVKHAVIAAAGADERVDLTSVHTNGQPTVIQDSGFRAAAADLAFELAEAVSALRRWHRDGGGTMHVSADLESGQVAVTLNACRRARAARAVFSAPLPALDQAPARRRARRMSSPSP